LFYLFIFYLFIVQHLTRNDNARRAVPLH